MAPLVNLPNNVVGINASVALNSLFTVSNITPGRSISVYRFRDNGVSGGFFRLGAVNQPANQWIQIPSSQLGQVFYRGDSKKSTESISIQVWDGVEWSNVASAFISTGNSTPVLTVRNGYTSPLERVLISGQFTYFDADGDSAVRYTFRDLDASANGGQFELNGVALPSNTTFTILPTQLGNLRYRGGTVSGTGEEIEMTVFDGFTTSAPIRFQMFVDYLAPNDFDVLTNEKLSAIRLFRFSDSGQNSAVAYQFVDRRINANGGYFEFKGQRMPSAAWFNVPAAELSQLFYVGAQNAQTESVGINVFDGTRWNSTEVDLTTHLRQNLSIQNNHYLNIETGRKSNSISDPNVNTNPFLPISESVERIRFVDRATNVNGGHFVFKGVRMPSGQWFTLLRNADNSFELEQLEYRGGTWGLQSELISVQTYSNGVWGEVLDFNVDTLKNQFVPVLTVLELNSRLGSVFPLSQIHTVTDGDGDRMTSFGIYDTGSAPDSGYFSINDVRQPALTWITLPYDQIGTVKYHMSTIPGREDVRMWVSDGTYTSATVTSKFQAVETPRYQFVANDISLDTLESVRVSSLLSQTDAGPPFTRYQVFDENFANASDRSARYFLRTGTTGNFGQQLLPGVVHTLNAEEFSRLDIQGAESDFGRALDGLLVRVTNDITGWSEWRRINVNTDPVGEKALQSLGAWNTSNGTKTVISFSFIDGQDAGSVRPPLPWYYRDDQPPQFDPEAVGTTPLGQPQREAIREIFDLLETFADVDFVEKPYQWTVADAEIVIGSFALDGPGNVLAYAYGGRQTGASKNGDIWFDIADFPQAMTVAQTRAGTGFYETAMHEIGHAIGLKHPFQGSPHLSIFNDFTYNTVMSYTQGTDGNPNNPLRPSFPGLPASYMLYDMVELQNLYGPNMEHRTADDQYTFARPTATNPVLQKSIWDAGGKDTYNLFNSLVDENVDLRPGTWSSVHGVQTASRIAYGVVMEYARTGAGNDTIRGNEVNNILFSHAGNDRLIGMGGNDWLYGGLDNDTYAWGLGDGFDRIIEEGGARDVIEFQDPSGSISSFEDDFLISRLGNDLRVIVAFDRGGSVGSVTVNNFSNSDTRVETLRLFNRGTQVGPDIDLTSAWATAGTFARRYTVTSSTSALGNILAPV
jgi:serralysin